MIQTTTKIFCDKCNKEISESEMIILNFDKNRDVETINVYIGGKYIVHGRAKYEICDSCYDDIIRLLHNVKKSREI